VVKSASALWEELSQHLLLSMAQARSGGLSYSQEYHVATRELGAFRLGGSAMLFSINNFGNTGSNLGVSMEVTVSSY
jgi:hypothetical protein